MDMFKPTSNMSNVSKGITENVQWVKKGSGIAVGNGKSTLFWDHPWVTNKSLRCWAQSPIPVNIEAATVEDVWSLEGDWRWDSFANILPNEFLKQIASHRVYRNLMTQAAKDAEQMRKTFYISSVIALKPKRSQVVFEGGNDIPLNVGDFLRNQVDNTWNSFHAYTLENPTQQQSKHTTLIHWIAPPSQWYALNTDGASKGTPGPAGGGGIIRDATGGFVCAFAANFDICSAYRAELMAISLGIDMAHSKGMNKLIIQVDNMACVQVLKNSEYQGGECFHIIRHCRALLMLMIGKLE
ncbi:hypothetical protein RDABS01_001729 [Bienertia sinuspersici]